MAPGSPGSPHKCAGHASLTPRFSPERAGDACLLHSTRAAWSCAAAHVTPQPTLWLQSTLVTEKSLQSAKTALGQQVSAQLLTRAPGAGARLPLGQRQPLPRVPAERCGGHRPSPRWSLAESSPAGRAAAAGSGGAGAALPSPGPCR